MMAKDFTKWVLVTAFLSLISRSVAFAELHTIQVDRVMTLEGEKYSIKGCNDATPCQRLGPRESYSRKELEVFLTDAIEIERFGVFARGVTVLVSLGVGGVTASCYFGPKRWLMVFPFAILSAFFGYTGGMLANSSLPLVAASDESREIMSMILRHHENRTSWTIKTEVNPTRLLKFDEELKKFFSHFSHP